MPLFPMLIVPAALAAEPDPLLRPEDRTAILQALSAADITVPDLSFEKDYVQADGVLRDPWRLPGIEGLLHAPLSMPADAARWSGGLSAAAGDPGAALTVLVEALGLDSPLRAQHFGDCAPAEKRTWKKLDPAIQAEVCRLAGALAPDRATGWLSEDDEQTLRTLLTPDGEDQWDATEAQRRTRALLGALDSVDLASRILAARGGLAALQGARAKLSPLGAERWPETLQSFSFGDRIVQVGSPGIDTFTAPLTLDPGGSDRHIDAAHTALTLHLDLGGDDLWQGGAGSLGGTIGGASVLIDVSGYDTYRASGPGAIGAGVGGVGILADLAGDDSYRGVATTQGAGVVGAGLLLDGAGSDTYDAGAYAQGYANVRGAGALWDNAGDDLYRAGGMYPDMPTRYPDHTLSLSQGFSIGIRPDAGGGLGLLVDEGGNDAYDADLFAQGCSYWFSRGYLVDRAGNDRYHTYQYGQGSGIHLSVAGLFDLAGQDIYAGGNLVQGSSHDLSVGWLIDRTGDDVYAGNSTSQGGSLTNSVTFMLDAAGDDAYLFRLPASRGQGRYDRNMGSIGVFVDGSGTDRYDAFPGDDHVTRPWAYGVAVDNVSLLPAPDPEGAVPPLRALKPASPELATRPAPSPEALAQLAAADSVMCATPPSCEAARALLVLGGPEVFARLLPALPRDILQEGYTLDAIFQALRSADNDPILYRIVMEHVAAGPAYPAERWAIAWLAALGIDPPGTAAALAPLATHPSPRLRNALATALLGWKLASPLLDVLLADPEETVRAVAVLALGASGGAPERVAALLRDESVLVRYNAAEVLLSRPPASVRSALVAEWSRGEFPTPAARRLVLEMLIRVGGKQAEAIVATVAKGDADPWAQRKAASKDPPFVWRAAP